jgi:hypothetical protein
MDPIKISEEEVKALDSIQEERNATRATVKRLVNAAFELGMEHEAKLHKAHREWWQRQYEAHGLDQNKHYEVDTNKCLLLEVKEDGEDEKPQPGADAKPEDAAPETPAPAQPPPAPEAVPAPGLTEA